MQDQLKQIKPHVEESISQAMEVANLTLAQVERAAQLAVEQTKSNLAFTKKQLELAQDLKDPQQAVHFIQSQLEASTKHFAAVAEATYELNRSFFADLSERADGYSDQKHAEVNKLIADNLKKAPQGSDVAVAAIKEAVAVGNKAVAEARKAAKQSVEAAEQTLSQLKSVTKTATASGRKSR